MKSVAFFIVALIPALFASLSSGHAACRVKDVSNTRDEIRIVVPFAVPVGVPVAAFAPYFYGYRQFQVQAQGLQPLGLPQVQASAPSRSQLVDSLVTSHCAACHAGAAPKAGLSLGSIADLSASDRLKAIRAVATGRMPKRETLSADEIRAVIEELTAETQRRGEGK